MKTFVVELEKNFGKPFQCRSPQSFGRVTQRNLLAAENLRLRGEVLAGVGLRQEEPPHERHGARASRYSLF